MTEEQARTKWCPFVRYQKRDEHPSNNRHRKNEKTGEIEPKPTYARCIASDCMAWRQTGPNYAIPAESDGPIRGYCGLAGKF